MRGHIRRCLEHVRDRIDGKQNPGALSREAKPDEHGDLYATADVQLPRELTDEMRSHFEALKRLETPS